MGEDDGVSRRCWDRVSLGCPGQGIREARHTIAFAYTGVLVCNLTPEVSEPGIVLAAKRRTRRERPPASKGEEATTLAGDGGGGDEVTWVAFCEDEAAGHGLCCAFSGDYMTMRAIRGWRILA